MKGSKADDVTLGIATAIVSGEHPAGSLLPSENALTERYDCGRSVIREAIQRLTASNMIEKRQGLGTHVNAATQWNLLDPIVIDAYWRANRHPEIIREIIELRRLIEVEAAGMAAERAALPQIDAMRHWLDQMTYSLERVESFVDADLRFHLLILEAASNRFLLGVERTISQALLEARRLTAAVNARPGLERALAQHERIFDAIHRRDPADARTAMDEHLRQTERDIERGVLQTRARARD